jgi:hypothetical protein
MNDVEKKLQALRGALKRVAIDGEDGDTFDQDLSTIAEFLVDVQDDISPWDMRAWVSMDGAFYPEGKGATVYRLRQEVTKQALMYLFGCGDNYFDGVLKFNEASEGAD